MAASFDLELKKAFTELQAKVIDTQQKMKLADIQIDQLNRTKKHAYLTDKEIMALVGETNMYEGVGRIYFEMDRMFGRHYPFGFKEDLNYSDTKTLKHLERSIKNISLNRFILQSKEVIHNQLLEKQKTAEEKIKELEQKKSYLERSVKEAQDNIREMLVRRTQ